MSPEDKEKKEKILYAKINQEAAQIAWKDLERFFAGGRLISVADHVDMIHTARLMADDDVKAISAMLEKKDLERLTDEKAKVWAEENPMLWAVVVKPWILVQYRKG